MKVLLVAPTIDTCFERLPSVGLMNLYLIGKELGCDMELLDLSQFSYHRGLEKILFQRYDMVGISCNFINAAPYCMRYAKDIKDKYPDTLVISGGNHATLVPEDLLFNGYDYIVYGEGEKTFEEFLKRRLHGREVKDLNGLYYLENGAIVKNHPRELIEDLDVLPLNDYSQFDLEAYFKQAGMRYVSIETSRGCIYNCAFCSTVKMWGHRYRHKSPQRILAEFEIAKKLNLDFVFIDDDDAAIAEENLRNFCQLLIDNKMNVCWGMTIGSNSIREESTFDLLKKSRCIKANISVESANPRLLKAYRKPHTIKDNKKLCKNLAKRGILVENHGLIGYPDETIREILNTYFYLIKTSPIWIVSILEPRPGSDYWNNWKGRGIPSQYRFFGKADVFWGRYKVIFYLIYRIFALFYFLNPTRVWKSLFSKNKAIRYSYNRKYYIAYHTIKQNFINFLKMKSFFARMFRD